MTTSNRHGFAIALSVVTAASALAVPAGAQLFNGGLPASHPRLEQVQLREFLPFPLFGGRRYDPYNPYNPWGPPRPQTFESTRAPPPRKAETPPAEMVLVIGDSLADWLAYGLEDTFADNSDIGIVRKIKPYAGLVRYEARADAPEWSQAVKDVLAAEKPSAIVVMLGVNDRLPLRDPAPRPGAQRSGQQPAPAASTAAPNATPGLEPPPASPAQSDAEAAPQSAGVGGGSPSAEAQRRTPGGSYEFHTDKWAELYGKRIDDMIAALKSKGVPVLWVGLPAIRGTRTTGDMSYLDELFRARVEKAGITYVDIWDGFVDEYGRYAVQGPDFEGQIRRLRTADGVHFTKAGAVKLAHYVEHELRRVLSNHVVPVALPGPEEQAPAKGATVGARPAIGPVVPLVATGGGEGGDLLGAPSHPAPSASDPLATRVLSRGDALAAPPGRADDFSWPRADAGGNSATDAAPGPVAPMPAVPPAKSPGGKDEAKKPADGKSKDAPNAAARTGRSPRAELDGAPRPPAGPPASASQQH